MRLALVIRSSYAENTVVLRRDAFLDNATLFAERIAAKDAAFELIELDASRELPETLEQLLRDRAGQLESLLVHFTGYVAVKADRGPALLLDGNRLRAFPLSRLRAALEDGAQQALVVINGLAVVDAEQSPDQVATSVGDALNSSSGSISSIVGIEKEPPISRRGALRLTDLLVLALDHLADKARGSLVTDNAVYQTMQSDVLSFAAVTGVAHHAGYFDFVLLQGPTVGGVLEDAVRQERSTKPVPTYKGPLPDTRPPGARGHGKDPARPAPEGESSGSDGNPASHEMSEVGSIAGTARARLDPARKHRRVPTLADTPAARAAGQREWLTEAAYFPSAPPPPAAVRPMQVRPVQTTLPGLPQFPDPELDPGQGSDSDTEIEPTPPLPAGKLETTGTTSEGEPESGQARGAESLVRDEKDTDEAPQASAAEDGEPGEEPFADDDEPSDAAAADDGQQQDESSLDDGEQADASPPAESLVETYEDLLAQMEADEDPRQAEIQAKLGDAYRAAQRSTESLFAYERALDLDPLQPEAFEGACAHYRDSNDFAGLVSTIERRLVVVTDPNERHALLDDIADIWLTDSPNYLKAVNALERRLAETPDDVVTLRRLVEAEDRADDLMGRLDSREQLAKCASADPELRATAWLEAAEVAYGELNDLARTFLLLESAIETGVLVPHTLRRAEVLLGGRMRWLEVVELYERALETASVETEAVDAAERLIALIHEQSCQDAIKPETLSTIVQLSHANPSLADAAITLIESVTHGAETLELLQRLRNAQPRNLALVRRVEALAREEHPDVAINLASVLVALGEASEPEAELAKVLSGEALPTPSRALDHADFETLLFPLELDREMLLGLARLEKVFMSAGAFEQKTALSLPKDAPVIDPETSTITVARSCLWTSRLLSVKAPELILVPDPPSLFRYLPEPQPRLVVSRALGTGFALPELVYLTSRQVALQLPGMLTREFIADPRVFGSLLYALAVVADHRKHGVKALPDSEQKLGKRLLTQLESDPSLDVEVDRVLGTEQPSPENCERRAAQWLKAVDQVRLRAALLACGTPSTAMMLNQRFPLESLLTEDEQFDQLAAFAGSPEHCELRSRLEIAAERSSSYTI